MGEIYAKIFVAIYLFFASTHLQVRPFGRFFVCDGSIDAVSRKDVPFGGYKILKLIFNVFIEKIPKNYNGAYGEN